MTNDLTTLAASLPSLTLSDDARQALAKTFDDDDKTGSSGVDYVYFSGKSGDLTYGQDREELDMEEEFVFLTPTVFKGWVCWKNSEVKGRKKWSAFKPQDAIAETDLEDHGVTRAQDGWKPSSGFDFMGYDGKQYSFESNTKSGRGSIKKVIEAALGASSSAPVPVFLFTKEKFLSQGEWNFKPVFKIVEFITEAEAQSRVTVEAEADEIDDVEEEAPAKKRVRRA
tara:strand:+ start:30041 stop:30718 length:678 start_codon:yes stop_codon:yes gene_type:complete